jgi:hypothetical protein
MTTKSPEDAIIEKKTCLSQHHRTIWNQQAIQIARLVSIFNSAIQGAEHLVSHYDLHTPLATTHRFNLIGHSKQQLKDGNGMGRRASEVPVWRSPEGGCRRASSWAAPASPPEPGSATGSDASPSPHSCPLSLPQPTVASADCFGV